MTICKKVTPAIAVTVFFVLCFSSGAVFAKMVQSNAPMTEHMTTSQVKKEIKKKHKGRIIYIKRKATRSHPNCHIVKMVTEAGEFKYIRYACGR